ncbi:MAG: hypothetical protein WA948_01210 [Pontixanthobacter sp.]
MRPIIVLCICAAGLLATFLLHEEETRSFEGRYEQAQDRIRDLAAEIDAEIARDEDAARTQ